MNIISLGLINAFFRTTSLISPKLSSRLAFKLFCTTIKPNTKSKKYQAMLSASESTFIGATRHQISYGNGYIAAYEFDSEKASRNIGNDNSELNTALLVHGWQSHARHLHKLIQPLQHKGYRVIALDLPGHGESSGRTFHIPMAVSALHAIKDTFGEFDVILSHSLGGAVVATALAGTITEHTKLHTSKIVLISPPNSVKKIFDDFAAMVGLSDKARYYMEDIVVKLSGKRTDDFNVADQLQTTQSSLLVLHAPDDKEVPFSEAQQIKDTNPTSILKPMPGLGHRRIIASDEVVLAAVEFISPSLPPNR